MVYGIGCDLCSIARMEKSLLGPMARSLHAGCSARRSRRHCVCLWQRKRARPAAPPIPWASAAADFAAKEAFLKAAGTGLREPFSLCEIEAVRLPAGHRPITFRPERPVGGSTPPAGTSLPEP